ncbi:unnamed protein product [Ixodes pacificus]
MKATPPLFLKVDASSASLSSSFLAPELFLFKSCRWLCGATNPTALAFVRLRRRVVNYRLFLVLSFEAPLWETLCRSEESTTQSDLPYPCLGKSCFRGTSGSGRGPCVFWLEDAPVSFKDFSSLVVPPCDSTRRNHGAFQCIPFIAPAVVGFRVRAW